jgi:hypothetical protein
MRLFFLAILMVCFAMASNGGALIWGQDVFGKEVANSTRLCRGDAHCAKVICEVFAMRGVSDVLINPGGSLLHCLG